MFFDDNGKPAARRSKKAVARGVPLWEHFANVMLGKLKVPEAVSGRSESVIFVLWRR